MCSASHRRGIVALFLGFVVALLLSGQVQTGADEWRQIPQPLRPARSDTVPPGINASTGFTATCRRAGSRMARIGVRYLKKFRPISPLLPLSFSLWITQRFDQPTREHLHGSQDECGAS